MVIKTRGGVETDLLLLMIGAGGDPILVNIDVSTKEEEMIHMRIVGDARKIGTGDIAEIESATDQDLMRDSLILTLTSK